MASRLVQAHTTAFGSSASRAPRRASAGAAQRRSDGRAARVLTAPRLREMAPGPRGRAAAAADDDVPELPDYDVVTLGPLETSALALSLRGWTGGSDDANAYVAAVDRGYVLFGAHAPSELALAKEYERYWRLSDAAQLPGVRAPQVYAIVEVGGDCSVADALQAHGIAAGGAEPDIFCLRAATAGSDLDAAALASSVAAAVELGACPAVFAVDGFDAPSLTRFVKALNALAPNARVAFNRVAFSVADAAAGAEGGVLRACAVGRGRGRRRPARGGRLGDGRAEQRARRRDGAAPRVPGRDGGRRRAALARAGGPELGDEQGRDARSGDARRDARLGNAAAPCCGGWTKTPWGSWTSARRRRRRV